jgi:hypothetical protein
VSPVGPCRQEVLVLAPGEYLLKPPEDTPEVPLAERGGEPPAPAPGQPEQPERESFLLILLRALGAVHT